MGQQAGQPGKLLQLLGQGAVEDWRWGWQGYVLWEWLPLRAPPAVRRAADMYGRNARYPCVRRAADMHCRNARFLVIPGTLAAVIHIQTEYAGNGRGAVSVRCGSAPAGYDVDGTGKEFP